jgi:hypothetical protein
MADFRDCIVSYIDMVGITALLTRRSKQAVHTMRKMHEVVSRALPQVPTHEEICLWNDSVLMVGFVTESESSFRAVMQEVLAVKRIVDGIQKSYAICVKGQAFAGPQSPVPEWRSGTDRPRLLYLQASSLAFANCFEIEHRAREAGWKWDWYIDNRIRTKLSLRLGEDTQEMELHPRSNLRRIHMYSSDFWDMGKAHESSETNACAS